ncbi:Rne/Rng family ribonuclease [Bacillus canaveralius]|uniref:Rne/Rng family ribonuclease n=1 Tax=Bacillus canaveralius TaxID=1403243 RepID=UPI000F798CBC|nr:ribonuclease E/G [Bacillus canaveralius]RSK52428.1 ribonuclease E/G [Bacillus canaveralius]
MDKLIVNYGVREKRFALLKGNRIDRLFIEQPKSRSAVGRIYLGIVTKVLPGMNAAFIDIGENRAGYLHRDKLPSYVLSNEEKGLKQNSPISAFVHQGERLLVQIEKDAAGSKGPRLTGIIELHGDGLVYMPNGKYVAVSQKLPDEVREKWRQFGHQIKREQEGLIFRTACAGMASDDVALELDGLRNRYELLQAQEQALKKPGVLVENEPFIEELYAELKKAEPVEIVVDDFALKKKLVTFLSTGSDRAEVSLYTGNANIFAEYKIEQEIEKALKRMVWLDNGAYLIFDEAEALTIIDVNTGKFSGKHDLQRTVVETNLLAAREIARQIRLRDIGGIILIDFIDMDLDEDRDDVLRIIKAELAKDERRTRVIGFTKLGILQLTRKKTKQSILEALTIKCPECEGSGRVISAETAAFRLERELWEYRSSGYEAVLVHASESVKKVFSGEHGEHIERLESALGIKIFFLSVNSEKPHYDIRQFGKREEIQEKAERS